MSVNRRSLLVATGALLLFRAVEARSGRSTAERLRTLISDVGAARRLGRDYLRQVPEEFDEGILVQAIFGEIPRLEAMSDTALRDQLEQRIQRDFDSFRTVDALGWTVALTEARACALISLV